MILTEEQKQRITKACVVEYQNDIKERKKDGTVFHTCRVGYKDDRKV